MGPRRRARCVRSGARPRLPGPPAAGRAAARGADRWRPRLSAPAHDLELAAPLAAGKLGCIRALHLQPLEVFRRDVAGDVEAGEAGGIELLDARVLVLAGGDQVLEILIDQPVRADQ